MDRVLILYTPTKFLIQCPQYAPINVTEDRLKVSPLPSFFLNGPRTHPVTICHHLQTSDETSVLCWTCSSSSKFNSLSTWGTEVMMQTRFSFRSKKQALLINHQLPLDYMVSGTAVISLLLLAYHSLLRHS